MALSFQWFKILFEKDDPLFLQTLQLACQRVGPKDFAIYNGAEFSDDDRIGYDVIYFSPSAGGSRLH